MTDQIIDHAERLNDLLPTQFKGLTNWEGFLNAVAAQVQTYEDEIYRFFDELDLNHAIGAQLDGLGEILGESRNSRGDTEYRSALRVRLKINTSSGEPETLIEVLAAITDSTSVQLLEPSTAYIELTFDGTTIPSDLLANMQLIKAAGVQLSLLVSSSSFPFTFDGDTAGGGLSSIHAPTEGGEFSGAIL